MGGVVPAWQTGTAAAGGAIVTVPGGQARQVALPPPTPFAYTGAPAYTYCFLRSTQTMRQRPANACVSTHDWRGELRRACVVTHPSTPRLTRVARIPANP